MSFLIFLLLVGLIFYLLFSKPKRKTSHPHSSRNPEVKKLVRDPVCGVYIDEEVAIKLVYKGETYYFCSEKCRDEFLKTH